MCAVYGRRATRGSLQRGQPPPEGDLSGWLRGKRRTGGRSRPWLARASRAILRAVSSPPRSVSAIAVRPRAPASRGAVRALLGVCAVLGGVALLLPFASSCAGDCAFYDVDVDGRTSNPEGAAYPTDNWGLAPREGNVAGQTLPNFTFRGYLSSDVAAGIQSVSMADYYDPSGTRTRVLLLMVGVMWCPHCNAATEQLVGLTPWLQVEGAAVVQVLIEGNDPGFGPDRCELADWVEEKRTSFPVLLDVGARRIGQYVNIDGVPWNAIVDPRTMEVLGTATGTQAVRDALAWVDANPR